MAITATKGQVGLTGNAAVAYAMKQVNPDVFPAYPITPSTAVVEDFASYVADGEVDSEFITVESEHSAMSACIGASAAGARVKTAASAQGHALMWEMLYIPTGLRLPIVMADVTRALAAPINIHCEYRYRKRVICATVRAGSRAATDPDARALALRLRARALHPAPSAGRVVTVLKATSMHGA